MKTTILLAAVVAAAFVGLSADADLPQQESREELLKIGKRVFTKQCSKCHFVPDPGIKRDTIWTKLIAITA